jgi:large-conductance mechanosensitive channel
VVLQKSTEYGPQPPDAVDWGPQQRNGEDMRMKLSQVLSQVLDFLLVVAIIYFVLQMFSGVNEAVDIVNKMVEGR